MSFIITINNKNYTYNNKISILNLLKDINFINYNKYLYIINNEIKNIDYIIYSNSKLDLIEKNSFEYINIISKSCSFILGYSIKKLWPDSKLLKNGIINEKFYYDLCIDKNLNIDDILKLEEIMNITSNEKKNILRKEHEYLHIKNIFRKLNEKYKITFLKKNNIKYNLCYLDNYIDFFYGISISNTLFIKNFLLEKKIFQKWYGYNINKIFYRIYGYIKNDIIDYKYIKNNTKLIKNKLYYISNDSPGMIFWKKDGNIIFNELKKYISYILYKNNYYEVKTPIIMKKSLWDKTGHSNFYYKNIYNLKLKDKEYYIKPMNCPAHVKLFNNEVKSYRDLPYRVLEFGLCHRNEFSGSLNGLMRTRVFTQDDTHIFCSLNQVESEIYKSIKIMYDIYNIFNFKNVIVNLSTRPIKRIGNDKEWNISENILKNVLNKNKIIFKIKKEEGAFYGPKIEFILTDSLNKLWQCGTIQLDLFLSKNLNSTYIDKNNIKKYPIIIHKAILGSIERFIGILTDHYNGKYPLWISPIQIIILSISNKQNKYANKIFKYISKYDLRIKLDIRNKTLDYKIREHIKYNIPYIIICGKKEEENNKISIKTNNGENLKMISIKLFVKQTLSKLRNLI